MFLAGIKFGLGFWLATVVFAALAMSVVFVISYISRFLEKRRKQDPKPRGARAENILWASGPEAQFISGDGFRHKASIRTVVTWRDRDGRVGRRKDPHYWQ